ncbi:hypothetical protein [Pseudodesulfovibrio sp. zrk46]|uniref:hypothetical protein n=1 Tax=Pseudodesulfovibrio sp. zrk46 TaxID=2725288 RepID=UPI00144A2BDC|nr:hypothetical protein [Pseudodesulfovibrio sp. zrk46]QJB55827.1 hypothetical protein HFN16_05135 [Pseudodesulfovibrio sp. zrk46]
MKKAALFIIPLIMCAIYLYNTNQFQAFFASKSFYANIVDVPFDVTSKGKQTTLPLKHKFNTCYDLSIAIPGREALDSRYEGKGQLAYQFISEGTVIADGITQPVHAQKWTGNERASICKLMVFDLPFPKASDDLVLRLEVTEPFDFLQEHKDNTFIVIAPNYSSKFDECYDEDLRITQ